MEVFDVNYIEVKFGDSVAGNTGDFESPISGSNPDPRAMLKLNENDLDNIQHYAEQFSGKTNWRVTIYVDELLELVRLARDGLNMKESDEKPDTTSSP
jgi:hypothetical protein